MLLAAIGVGEREGELPCDSHGDRVTVVAVERSHRGSWEMEIPW